MHSTLTKDYHNLSTKQVLVHIWKDTI